MKKLRHLLNEVYKSDELDEIENEVQRLVDKYSKLISKSETKLTHEDLVLITYGDQVCRNGESKLQTLSNLLIGELAEEVTIIHLLPFFPYCSDDGFSVIDYYMVNPDIGTWSDIENLSQKFKLLFDGVINHTSNKCKWFEEYLKNNESYKDYYIEVEKIDDYINVTRPRTTPLTHNYYRDGRQIKIWTTFSEEQVDLNFKNPKVFLQILDVLLFYIAKGGSILRLDAIGFLWKEEHSTCIHLWQTHALIKAYRYIIETIAPSFLLLTETNVPHEENISYFGNGDEAHMVYNFTLPPLLAYCLLSENVEKLTQWAKTLEHPYPNVCFFNFLASHDGIGLRPVDNILGKQEVNLLIDTAKANDGKVSYKLSKSRTEIPYEINCNYFSLLKGKEKDAELGLKRFITAQAILLAMPGLPAIYFHSIFGSENDIEGFESSGINRRINRKKFEYDNFIETIRNPSSRQSKILNHLKKIINVRKIEPAFDPFGHFSFDSYGSEIFIIERISKDGANKLIAIFNLSKKDVKIDLNDSDEKYDIINNQPVTNMVELSSLEFAWLKYI